MKSLTEFKYVWEFLKKEKKKLLFASILIFIGELSEIFTGFLNGSAVNAISTLKVKEAIIFLGIYLIMRLVVDSLILPKSYRMLQEIENVISRKLGYFTYKKALDLPAYDYEKLSSGEVINRIVDDTDTLSYTFEQLLEMFTSLVGSLILIIHIFLNSWIIGFEIIIFLIIIVFLIKKYNPILKQIKKEIKKENDKYTSLITESIRGVREIKTLGIKNSLLSDIKKIIRNLFNKNKEEIDERVEFEVITKTLKTILECGVFFTCIILLFYGKTTLTFFVAMTYYIYRYMWLIENINSFTKTYQSVSNFLERVNEILENKLYKDEYFGNNTIKDVKGVIEFKDVTFGYPNEKKILENFNLKLEPNKKIAIVGKSGQGKTTLFNLLTRVFDPTSGEILLDGVNISSLKEDFLRKEIAIIRQEPFIFNRSIIDNFKLINKDIDLKTIKKYTKLVYLDDYIMSLPNNYDTLIGEGGVNLSGGQKQRLSIARALAKESKAILFDEATSALDNSSQEYIKKAIDNLVKDHTVIIVAHRLSTIIDADIIYVVNEGKIVASGTHKELLKYSTIYKNLYEMEDLDISN